MSGTFPEQYKNMFFLLKEAKLKNKILEKIKKKSIGLFLRKFEFSFFDQKNCMGATVSFDLKKKMKKTPNANLLKTLTSKFELNRPNGLGCRSVDRQTKLTGRNRGTHFFRLLYHRNIMFD